jgi:hypothetical protein
MVLTNFHSPLRFGAFIGVGAGVGRFELAGAFSEDFVSGVATEVLAVLLSFAEFELLIR